MKILEEGVFVDKFRGKKLTCKECHCTVELEGLHDVARNFYEPDICIVQCPKCPHKITFAEPT